MSKCDVTSERYCTKLPARHRKMVRMQVAGVNCEDCNFILFESEYSELEEKCLLAPETLISVHDNNRMVLVLENHGCEPIYLEVRRTNAELTYNATMCPGWEVNGQY